MKIIVMIFMCVVTVIAYKGIDKFFNTMIEWDDGNKWYDLVVRDFVLGWKEMTKSIFLIPTLIVIYKIWNLEAVIVALLFIYVLSRFVVDKVWYKAKYLIKRIRLGNKYD